MFTFQFLNDKIDQNTIFAKLPSAKWLFWYNCKFYHSKIEKESLSLSQFSLVTGFFEGTRENILHKLRAFETEWGQMPFKFQDQASNY